MNGAADAAAAAHRRARRAAAGRGGRVRADRRLRLVRLQRLLLAAGVPEPADRQRLPVHRRRRHDLRDPVRRHRPVGGLGDRADDHGLGRAGGAAPLERGAGDPAGAARSAPRSAR